MLWINIKVVIRLLVNRLPVKLPVSIFSYRFTGIFLYVMQFSASALSHTLKQANKDVSTLDPDIPTPSDSSIRWFIFTQYLTVESAPLPSPTRVLLATSSDLIVAAYTGAGLTSTATWADFPGLHLLFSVFTWAAVTCSSPISLRPLNVGLLLF